MDDSEHLCPLCCEELDISDQQFFPCKCGYQVCMWCWHRIRESESGLCPACRTPYGDDPHEFSAVDVAEVLKANKEKEAAAKKERERQRQSGDMTTSDMETLAQLLDPSLRGQMEIPKDRTQLANMRVIRRNLVYAVGLPPSIANEDTLRKGEYFGQYGKLSKIVLNRSQATGVDPRRASASAYVTFFHKEDTLACILALDSFYLDGRSVRASYGTSKYCSAFIKNVRCNNPECTYLHQMGDVEDTFTKQEIQAGYVTSGRDVLARQQQIVEQMMSAQGAAAGSAPRRRVGGGGPSGTGRAATTPVFPAPSFDEPSKPPPVAMAPPAAIATRSASTGTAFPPMGANGTAPVTPAPNAVSARAVSAGPTTTQPVPASVPSKPPHPAAKNVLRAPSGPPGATAASVVAGMHSVTGIPAEPPAPHTTLTPLTPLKRVVVKGAAKEGIPGLPVPGVTNSKLTSLRPKKESRYGSSASGVGALGVGGSLIGASAAATPPNHSSHHQAGPSTLSDLDGGIGGLGGEVFNGPLSSSVGAFSGQDKWNTSSVSGDPILSANQGGLWTGSGGSIGPPSQGFGAATPGGVIGGAPIGNGNGTSALASMLGISLPTGSGSLRESPDLWNTMSNPPIAALNGTSIPMGAPNVSNPSAPGNDLIGGVPLGGSGPIGGATISSGGNKSDIAVLQSLLPGVHITGGGGYAQGNGFGSSSLGMGAPQQSQQWRGGVQAPLGGQPVGAIGQGNNQQKQRQAPGSIW